MLLVIASIIACLCFYSLRTRKIFPAAVWTVYTALFLSSLVFFFSKVIHSINHPKVFDFTAFFLWGKTAAQGYDFYLPQNLQLVFNSLQLPPADYKWFSEEIVNVGFLYPPPSILYFVPLGFLSYKAALLCWSVLNVLFAFGCIYLIYDLFFRKDKLKGLMLVTILFIFQIPVLGTIMFMQTNFILLFYLLLVKKYQERKFVGVFVALAMFTKPYIAIIILFFVVKRQWNVIAYFLASTIVMVGLTLFFFGLAPFRSYIFDSPLHRMPALVFWEEINQSLHAVLLRMKLISFEKSLTYSIILSVIALLSLLYLVWLKRKLLYDFILPYLLLIGLLVYPGTLSYYGVILLFIVFQFFDEEKQLGFNAYITIIIIAIFCYLSGVSLFLCICFLLVVIVFKSIREMLPPWQDKFRLNSG